MATTARHVLALLFALLLWGSAHADRGVAELALDRSAVAALLAAAIPDKLPVPVPGVGEVTIGVQGPDRVEFRDGAVEATFSLSIAGIGWDVALRVRYRPEVEPNYGVVRLVPIEAELPPPLNATYDPIRWMPVVDLPRQLEWDLELQQGGRLRVRCYLQGVRIDDERLVMQLGLQLSGR
jgi:hypothetical protein